MDFNFFMPVKVLSGENVVAGSADVFGSFGKSCLIVTGGSSAKKSGALADVTKALEKSGISYTVFEKIGQNPLISSCREAGEEARKCDAEFIIGIGGGSPLDAAKAIAIYATNEELTALDIFKREYKNAPLPVVLVGTTAGTGSEVSPVSVLTDDESGRKKSISGPDCYAKVAFADPKYTHTVPYDFTVSTALDAFAHAVEGWFSSRATDIVDIFACQAIPMLWDCLLTLYNNKETPDSKTRERLYYGSLYAGIVLNACGTAFPHPMGYVLTEKYGISHGRACTTFMPAYVKRAMEYKEYKANTFFDMIDCKYDEFAKIITELTDTGNIKMTKDEIDGYCERWQSVKNFDISPGGYSKEEAQKLLAELFI